MKTRLLKVLTIDENNSGNEFVLEHSLKCKTGTNPRLMSWKIRLKKK